MPDWTRSMSQTFEYYLVNPNTWGDDVQIRDVTSCSIDRDSTADTLGSASIDFTEDHGEEYIREYLVTRQNGITERFPLGTHLIQSPKTTFDGRVGGASIDGYTPLIELKENPPPIGYTVSKGANIMNTAYALCRENMRAPVIPAKSSEVLYDDFVANTSDTWLSFIQSLVAQASFYITVDENGVVMFAPIQDTKSLQPVMTFDDGNSSILYPSVTYERDLYSIPNVVEVLYSSNSKKYYARVENNDKNSPTSIVNRGRMITYRDTNPSISGLPNQQMVQEYAEQLLRNQSALEYKITYSHAYCGNRIGDCIRLNYERAGLVNIKARVISQSFSCAAGCKVTETATYTVNTWK